MLIAPDALSDSAAKARAIDLDDLLIVIVLYRTIPEHSLAYTSVRKTFKALHSAPDIYIYDNSPESTAICARNVTYFHDPRNSGVSAAYNRAAAYALQKQKKWLLLLDQDTSVTERLFSIFANASRMYPTSVAFVPRMVDRNGILSPFRFSPGRTRRIGTTAEKLPLNTYRFINSGLVIRLSAFNDAGGYDESIPLDFSDMFFGERLSKVTDHFIVLNAALQHEFSNNEKPPVDSALARFRYFCAGSAAMGRHTGYSAAWLFRTLLRACRLTIRYRDYRFLIRFFRFALHD